LAEELYRRPNPEINVDFVKQFLICWLMQFLVLLIGCGFGAGVVIAALVCVITLLSPLLFGGYLIFLLTQEGSLNQNLSNTICYLVAFIINVTSFICVYIRYRKRQENPELKPLLPDF
jgi:hypothetical protein